MHYVMSDIHGDSDAFDKILAMIDLKAEDHLYVLGDVVDRGPDGIELLQRIRQMKNCTLLLGNHEYMMINALRHPKDDMLMHRWLMNGCETTYERFMALDKIAREDLLKYLEALPVQTLVIVRKNEFILVHAAPLELFEDIGWMHENRTEFAVWYRMPLKQYERFKGKITIFGHTPTMNVQFTEQKMRFAYGDDVIDIDCGCAYPQYGGQLGCLRLEDMTEYYSAEGVVTLQEAATWRYEQEVHPGFEIPQQVIITPNKKDPNKKDILTSPGLYAL